VALVCLAVLLAEVAGPVADLMARAAGPLRPEVVAGPGWPVVVAAVGVAAGSLSLLPAWPLLHVLAQTD